MTEKDVQFLIDSREKENIHLDYKASPSLSRSDDRRKEDVSKDVSAFANSAGGRIIYGVIEKEYYPEGIDNGYDPKDISREWLESIIHSSIQPRVDGIRIFQIELSNHPGRVIYVVDIPQSSKGPHMAKDHRYYKRFNFSSCPMEDYEVRDVSTRNIAPDLIIIPKLSESKQAYEDPQHPDHDHTRSLELGITNLSSTPAEYAMIHLILDERFSIDQNHNFEVNPFVIAERPARIFTLKWGLNSHMPIWKGTYFSVSKPLVLAFPKIGGGFFFGWQITSPHMNIKQMYYYINPKELMEEVGEKEIKFDGEKRSI